MAMSPITTVRLGNPEPAEKKEMFRESLGLPPLRSNVASQEVSQKRADYLADLERVGSDPARSALERHTATTSESLAEPPKEMFRASLGLPPLRSASLSQTPVPPAEDLPTEDPPEPESSLVQDLGISALKGAVRLPAAIVGLADIPTFGAVGKALESAGYRPADAQKILEDSFSPAMKASLANVEGAEGFWEKLGASIVNPRALSNTIIESLPLMLGGAGIARGVTGALARVPGPAPLQLPAIAAAAIGEGTIGAGSAATQMREQSADGRLTGKQSAAAIASGVGTGLLGAVGGTVARKIGLEDIDTALASGALTGTAKAGFAKRVVGGGITEGVFEEMPQSAQEQMWQNFAADRPITEGVAEASATGLIAGAVTGGAFGALLFKRVKEDDRVARLLEEAGIESATDPRFQELVAKNLSYLDIPSAEQLQETRKQRQADVTEAFGDTASTGVGVNTGTPDQQVIRRDSVIPNPETRMLDPIDGEAPVPATLPATERTPEGTVAVSGEDIVARQAGFDVEPAFQIGTGQVQNRFRSQAQAETFLFGPVGQDGVRAGGYADSVPDLEFQIRRGQAAKQAGQSPFFFVESRPAQAGPATPEATPEAAPEAPEASLPDFAAAARAWEASQGQPAQPGPSAAVSPASAWDAFGGIEFDALPAMAQQDWTEAIEEGYSPSVLANLYTNLVAEAATPQGAEAQPPAPVTATAVTPPAETQESAQAIEQGAQAPSPTLPKDLAGASPRYGAGKNQYTLSFESDIDKALYITAQPTPSKRDADFRSWLQGAGISEADIAARSKQVRDAVKSLVAGQKGGTNVVVPAQPAVAESRAKPPALETKPAGNPATGAANSNLGQVTDEFSQALTNARSASPRDALRLARGLQSQGLLDQQTLAVAERVASEDGATAESVVDAFEAQAKRAVAALVAETQKPGGRKQRAGPTVEQQLKEKQAQRAAQQAPRKPPNSPDETAEEWWEQNDDGKNHVAWKDLPVAKQQAWEDAKADGDATPDFHDSIVNSVRTAGRNERSTRGTQEQDDAPKLSRKIKRDFAYVRVTSIADLIGGVRASQRKAGEQPTFSAAPVRDADVARRVSGLRGIERAAALFGKKVQFFEVTSGEDFFNGAVIPGSSTIFININSNRPSLSIFGHELVHAIKNEHPELYKQLTAALKPLIDSKALVDYGSQQTVNTAEDILEEAQGDIVGSRFGEQEFWQELADLNPSMFKSLADVATRFINKLIDRLRGSGSFESSKNLISDLDAARKGIAAVLNDLATMVEEEAQQTGQQTAPSTTGGVKFSGNDIERARERREIKAFSGTLREEVKARSAEKAELVAQMTKDGAYDGLEVGDTILTTNPSGVEFRQRLLSKVPVSDKDGEYELRGKRYSAGFIVDVINSNGDSYQSQMNLDKAKGRYTKMTGPKLERAKAEFYARDNDILPYTQADGPIEIETLDDLTPKFAIKQPYAGKDLSDRTKVVTNKKGETRTVTVKARVNHPTLGLPLNQNGTVTLYYPTTNEEARRVAREKTLRGDSGATRIYLTNESSGGKILNNPGAIDQNVGGANVLIHIDPDVLQLAREYEDGRKDFFIPVKEGEEFKRKMRQIKLFNENRSRDEGLHPDRTLKQITEGITKAVSEYSAMTAKEKARRLSDAKDNLKRLHNIGTLLTVNGKLEKTNLKGYEDLVDVDQDVLSMGLGMAAAQRINNLQKLNTCPNRAICQDLCLGSTSGQNQLYGGDGPFRAGPRLAQYLKTEALVVSPEDFSVLLYSEVESLQRQAKRDGYKPSVRLNVTTDFHPDTFAALIRAFPDVMFYDYTKLDSRPIAPNHHLTYSSTGASQIVNGKVVFNQHSNWDRMVRNLLQGRNVAMAFTSRQDIPEFVVDEATGRTFKVWDGDLYDARFIDPKQTDGIGMIIGLTNKDRTTKPEDSAKKHNGFFMDYDKARDGSTLTILDQSRFTAKDNGQPPLPVGTQAIRFSRKQPTSLGFVSALENGIDQLSMTSAQPTGWQDAIRSLINKGAVKAEEAEWSGINDWLMLQKGKVSKEQVAAYLERGGVKVAETSYVQSDTTYSNWVQPGGRNYREMLLHLPESDEDMLARELEEESGLTADEKAAVSAKVNYRSRHWHVPNVIAHVRTSDHTDQDGKRVLFVEEIQSDWGQEGKRQGFAKREDLKKFEDAVAEYEDLGRRERALQGTQQYRDWFWIEEYVYHWGGSPDTVSGLKQAKEESEDAILEIKRGRIDDPDEIDRIRGFSIAADFVLSMRDPQAHIDKMKERWRDVEEIRSRRQNLRAQIRILNGISRTPPGPFVAARRFSVIKDGKELITKNKEGKDVLHRYDNMGAAKAAAAKHGGDAFDMGQQASTDGWLSLALKRVVSLASQEGYDRVAFVTGQQAAKMFSLRGVADSVYVIKNGNDTYTVSAQKERGGLSDVLREDYDLSLSGIEEIYGKGFAQQVEAQTKEEAEYRGEQLEVGGEGMAGFYDHIVPSTLKKLLPKVGGGKVSEVKVNDTVFRKGKKAPETYPGSYVPQMGFDVTSAMRDKVDEGLPMFSRKQYERQFEDLPDDTRRIALAKVAPTPPTIRERLEAMKPSLAMRLTQGMFDKVRSVRDISEKAYMQLRLSSSVDGAVEALLHFGQVFNDDGALNIKRGTRGLIEVMQPLGAETDRFLMWIAANRAENLKAQDRELFFTDDEIRKLKKLNLGTMKNGKQRISVYAEAMRGMNDLNRSVLDVARNSGLIDEAAYQRFASDIWYVPFYRYMEEDGTLSAASTASGSVNQYFSKLLKGSERPLNDLMENVLMNWSHILSSSMKNLGSVEALKAADNLGGVVTRLDPVNDKLGKDKSGKTHALSGTAKVMERGKTVHYMIDDPLLLQSLSAVASIDKSNFLLNIGRTFKTTLTRGVALSPTFKTNNLIRDAVQSIGLTELDYNPVANVYQGIKAYRNDRGEALAGGGVFTMGNAFDGDRASAVKRLVRKGANEADIIDTPEKAAKLARDMWDVYDHISDAMENSNRLALYKQMREKGASHLEAAYAARDLQDFTSQGAWAAVRYLNQILPYFNARMQGLYKMGRDGIVPAFKVLAGTASESERKKAAKFSTVASAVTAAGLLLYLAQKDDDDWKQREDWDRDMFFWFKLPGTDRAIRIPKPFEIGSIATIAERVLEQIVDKDVDGGVFGKRMLSLLTDTFAVNIIPQYLRPMADVARNKDGLSGAPIESLSQRRLSAELRTNPRTSGAGMAIGKVNAMLADGIGSLTGADPEKMKLSPVQYDYMIKSYLGWIGTVIQTSTYYAAGLAKEGEMPAMRLDDTVWVGNYVKSLPANESRYVTDFYATAEKAARATADFNNLIDKGEIEEARARRKDDAAILSMAPAYSDGKQAMSDISDAIKRVQRDKRMSAEDKRKRMDDLYARRNLLAKRIELARIRKAANQ